MRLLYQKHQVEQSSPNQNKRILLGQLVSNGDCLYATTIARQIKEDYPNCHLTWAIGSNCRSILNENPHVDEIWEIPISNSFEGIQEDVWERFAKEANERRTRGDFDEIFFTQILPTNLQNHDGCVRSSIFRGYPKPITVPVAPVLRLSPDEIEKVSRFAQLHGLNEYSDVILFECSPQSQQSFVTPDFALEASQLLVARMSDICVILSSAQSIDSVDKRIIDGSVLTLRETAELTKYCSLLIGCSSGITWISTSDWAKPLPLIQILNPNLFHCNSPLNDFAQWNLDTNNVLEMIDCSSEKLSDCVDTIFRYDFGTARAKFQQSIPLKMGPFFSIQQRLLSQGRYKDALSSLNNNIRRNKHRREFMQCHGLALISVACPWLLKTAYKIRTSLRSRRAS